MSRRDQVLAQAAFYSGARCVLKVLGYLVEGGDVDSLQRVIGPPRADHPSAARVGAEKATPPRVPSVATRS